MPVCLLVCLSTMPFLTQKQGDGIPNIAAVGLSGLSTMIPNRKT